MRFPLEISEIRWSADPLTSTALTVEAARCERRTPVAQRADYRRRPEALSTEGCPPTLPINESRDYNDGVPIRRDLCSVETFSIACWPRR
jgi:hypothetical protein